MMVLGFAPRVGQSVGIDKASTVPDAGRVAFAAACDTTDCRRESISSFST